MKKLQIFTLALLCLSPRGFGQSGNTFQNPILQDGADPYAYLHEDGYYYFMVTRGNRLDLWRSKDLTDVRNTEPKTIWTPPATGANSCCVWAPEIHYLNDKWYMYYSAANMADQGDDTRFVFVLENSAKNPLDDKWIDKGKINTKFSGIDGSVFNYRDRLYFLYSPYVDNHSDVMIVEMENPWTLTGPEVSLAAPLYDWEKTDDRSILEGPMFLDGPGDKVFIVYSGGACWDDNYSLGLLTANRDADLLDAASWSRSPKAVFEMSTESDVYGPGHHGLAYSPDRKEQWLIFHAKDKPGLGCSKRSSRMQRIQWKADGMPDFGQPWPLSQWIPKPSGTHK